LYAFYAGRKPKEVETLPKLVARPRMKATTRTCDGMVHLFWLDFYRDDIEDPIRTFDVRWRQEKPGLCISRAPPCQ